MGLYLATEKWIDNPGDEDGLLDQFATTSGYSDLIAAAEAGDYPTLCEFFREGLTEEVEKVRVELQQLSEHARDDVAITAKGLRDLAKGQEFLVITDGCS